MKNICQIIESANYNIQYINEKKDSYSTIWKEKDDTRIRSLQHSLQQVKLNIMLRAISYLIKNKKVQKYY